LLPIFGVLVALVAAADRLTAHRACYLASNAVSTITASTVTVAMRKQAGGLGKAQHSRAPLLTAHAQLAVRHDHSCHAVDLGPAAGHFKRREDHVDEHVISQALPKSGNVVSP
jgi:predicted secreted hydrolase